MSDDVMTVLQSAGLQPKEIQPGKLYRCKTQDDRPGELSGWFRLFESTDTQIIVYGDWRQGFTETWCSTPREAMTQAERSRMAAALQAAKLERQREQARQYEINRARLYIAWQEARPVTNGDPVSTYLQHRSLTPPKTPDIRLHPAMPYWLDGKPIGKFPTMLLIVRGADGDPVTLHRTFLRPDGTGKADVAAPKKLMPGAGPLSGGSIRLSEPGSIIGVTEGAENAIAASALFGLPVWAAVSASGLASFCPPRDCKELAVFADHDRAGLQAAERLVERMKQQGRTVRVVTPPTPGTDWNDELMKGGEHGTL